MKFNRVDVTGQVNGEARTGYGNRTGKKNNKQINNLWWKKVKQEKRGFCWFRMVTASHELGRKIYPAKG